MKTIMAWTTWATLPVQLSEIRQIEVVKGPNSALYGFNAAYGVINIITYDPEYDATNAAKVRVGNIGQRHASLTTTFKVGPALSVRLSGGGDVRDEWKVNGTLPPGPTGESSSLHNPVSAESNLGCGGATGTPKTVLRVEGSWSNVQEDGRLGFYYQTIKLLTTSAKATLTSDTALGLIQASAYQNQVNVKYPDIDTHWINTVDVANIQDLFKIGARNTFRISGEFRNNTLNTSPIGGGQISYDVWSGSGMWNWAINSQFTTTAAIRLDDLMLHRSGGFPAGIPLADNDNWNRGIVQPSVNLFTGAWHPRTRRLSAVLRPGRSGAEPERARRPAVGRSSRPVHGRPDGQPQSTPVDRDQL